ncbi:hypothetical protein [Vreelandella profundi]|uniref:hypothetical protein n=1 Tax=Vreelandella profundi TaxID=2852117 RepID=UPI001F15DB5E|nr:hypothetical protein [Halomonas profundi]
MNHVTSLRYVIQHWILFAMRDGYSLHNTVIDAEQVPGGYLPAFTGAYGTRVVVEVSQPLPTPYYARIALRNVLWAAHVDGRISLQRHPLETAAPAQEQAA